MIIHRRRKQSTQSGYLTTRVVQGKEFYIANYYEYPRDPETGEPTPLHRTVPDPIGEVAKITKEAAKKKCARLVHEKLAIGKDHDGRTAFKWFAENEYLATFREDRAKSSNDTRDADLEHYVYPYLGSLALEEINISILKEHFLNKLGESGRDLSQSVVKRAKDTVRSILDYAVEREYLIGNPAASRRYTLPQCKPKDTTTAKLEDIGRLISAIRDDKNLVVMTLGQAGAGPAEIFSIEIESVHLDDTTLELTNDDYVEIKNSAYRGKLIRGKTKTVARRRNIWISSIRMKTALLRLVEKAKDEKPDTLLFSSRAGKTMSSGVFLRKRIHPIGRKLGIPKIDFRILRRSFMTWLRDDRRERLRDIQKTVGHAENSEVTERVYMQEVPERQAELVRHYAELCDRKAREWEQKQERRKLTREQIAVLEIEEHRKLTGRVQ